MANHTKGITKRKRQLRAASSTYWRKKRDEYIAQGLTTKGKPRLIRLHPEISQRHKPDKWKRMMRMRKYRLERVIMVAPTPLEQLRREIRSETGIGFHIEDEALLRQQMYE